MTDIAYVVSESLKSVLHAAGMDSKGDEIPPCPLHVGDVISDPAARGLFLRVTGRWFVHGDLRDPARWYVTLEQAGDPLAHLNANRDTKP